MTVNILITLIGLTAIALLIVNFYPQIEKILQEKLNLSLSGNESEHGILSDIFYRYNHKSSVAWTEWILTQDRFTKIEAIERLVQHLEQDPSNWGAITNEAIIALSKFKQEEFLNKFKTILVNCKRYWKRYKVAQGCYLAALEGCIRTSEIEALKIISSEIDSINDDNQAEKIVDCLKDFSEGTNLSVLVIKLLTDPSVSFMLKKRVIADAMKKDSDQAIEDIIKSSNIYLCKKNPYNLDELKLIDEFLSTLIYNLNARGFTIILNAFANQRTAATTIRLIEQALKENHEIFNDEQLYKLLHIFFDKKQTIKECLCEIHRLTTDERSILNYFDFERKYPFKKGPLVEEKFNEPLAIPPCINEYYENFKFLVKETNLSREGASGVVITGDSDVEKLCLARAYASEKKWCFLYTSIEDILGSSTTAKTVSEKISSEKPCLLYLDNIELLLETDNKGLSRSFIQTLYDPMITVLGGFEAINLDINDIEDEGYYQLPKKNDELKMLFPRAYKLAKPTDGEKNLILAKKLSKLEPSRDRSHPEQFNILGPTTDMSLFEFEEYLSGYLKASLLTKGKLIDSGDFQRLEEAKKGDSE